MVHLPSQEIESNLWELFKCYGINDLYNAVYVDLIMLKYN